MSMTTDSNNQNDTDIDQLLTLAGPRDPVPAARLERMRGAVHDAWKGTVPELEGQTPLRAGRSFVWILVTAATAAAITITVIRTWPDTKAAKRAEAVAAAIQITTGRAERKSQLLPGGGELRVDASSVVSIAGNGEIHISKGAVYLDSRGKTLPAVVTPAGTIADVGTRFEVRIVGNHTRVRVRAGKVRLALASTVSDVGAAEELLVGADGSVESVARRHVDPFGAEWAWVARAAPRFELEGRSLGDFLDWIATEGGWTIAFASPALERRARATELHGSIESMSTTEALETILPACGLTHRIDLKTGRVTVFTY